MSSTVLSLGAPEITDVEFGLLRDLIHAKTGIALKDSKRALVSGRLVKRLRDLGLESYSEYYRILQNSDPGGVEMRQMINCITTNKTSFFREEAHFPVLADHFRAAVRRGQTAYRIWSAACSSGEEPYSIAMTLLPESRSYDVRILASDIDTDVLAQAEDGLYPLESLEALEMPVKRRFFLKGRGECEGLAHIKPEVKELVQFRRINLIEDAWPIHTKFDAIFCRNVIIYFDRATQRRLFERLSGLLSRDGLLFVGHSETLYWLNDLLVPVRHSVYRTRP